MCRVEAVSFPGLRPPPPQIIRFCNIHLNLKLLPIVHDRKTDFIFDYDFWHLIYYILQPNKKIYNTQDISNYFVLLFG